MLEHQGSISIALSLDYSILFRRCIFYNNLLLFLGIRTLLSPRSRNNQASWDKHHREVNETWRLNSSEEFC